MLKDNGFVTRQDGHDVRLESPTFGYNLDTSDGLRAVSWENRLTGSSVSLGHGLEFEVDIDTSVRRIGIEGWRATASDVAGVSVDEETGFREGYYAPYFDDSAWGTTLTPAHFAWDNPEDYYWFRTHVFISPAVEGMPLSLVLGGFGVWDFRYMRVFLNGQEIGERETAGRWFEPGQFDLGPDSGFQSLVRFGQDNIVAIQMARPIRRVPRLDELDPHCRHHLPYMWANQPQFEQYFVVGDPISTPKFAVRSVEIARQEADLALTVNIEAIDLPMTAQITYRWESGGKVLKKHVSLRNNGDQPRRLLNVRLGGYHTDVEVSDGEQGFPVYLDHSMFASLCHPSGWATGQDGRVLLRQYPGRMLLPGDVFESMDVVFGADGRGEARRLFLDYLRTRMRRTTRGHDKTIAIFEPFGGRPDGDFNENEEFVLDNIGKVEEGRKATGYKFDYYSVDFWVDPKGDLTQCASDRFPRGFANIKAALEPTGSAMGLWIDSTCGDWCIGDNPVVAHCRVNNPGYPYSVVGTPLCRATDPFKTMFATAFRRHIRENGVRMLKFDNLHATCHNATHDHLPGVYSTEAIQSAVIETLSALDAECPEVFLMLYWGYRSPWWLLHADTLFEPGIMMEAASPSPRPSLYARDGVGIGLDQAQAWAEDVPKLGKDSLGIWLSSWPWNSSIGKDRWQEGMVLDMCRGSLLIQPWSDTAWLTPSEREEFARLLSLAREREDCFRNSRPILASAWQERPYGYSCTHEGRGFVVINNCTWDDTLIGLQLSEEWGLSSETDYCLYRHYPRPAELVRGDGAPFRLEAQLWMRPFEVVLLEVVPAGEEPAGRRELSTELSAVQFAESSRRLECLVESRPSEECRHLLPDAEEHGQWRTFSVTVSVPSTTGADLVLAVEIEKDGRAMSVTNIGMHFLAEALVDGGSVVATPVLGEHTYPASWQAWRIARYDALAACEVRFLVAVRAGGNVSVSFQAYHVPQAMAGPLC